MHQVMLNLAVNAADAMPQGGDLVFATELARPRRQHGPGPPDNPEEPQLMVTVTDTGVGIPEGVRGRIFEPFFTTKEQGKGTGMGLAMVYGIVKNHGGTVDLESAPGRGTTFSLTLPLFEEAGAKREEKGRVEGVPPTRVGRILVVDDEEIVRNVAE